MAGTLSLIRLGVDDRRECARGVDHDARLALARSPRRAYASVTEGRHGALPHGARNTRGARRGHRIGRREWA
jgi:hypothetical protein